MTSMRFLFPSRPQATVLHWYALRSGFGDVYVPLSMF